jgi:ArsR family transcriptional regulator, arsenate/arsenite/antimonite-responsive transcriptional repressor
MDERQAVAGFAGLAQHTRLRIVRGLVRAGPDGMAAGAVAAAVGVSPSNLTFHLKELEHAGLVRSRRAARSIIYAAEFAALGALIRFLMEDCCAGHPEICAPALAAPCCHPEEAVHD